MAEDEKKPLKVTDIESARMNIESAVQAFAARWLPWPKFDIGVEIMDQGQLRDAMGLRATIDLGFCWQWLSGHRVMYLKEKDGYEPPTGWEEAEEYKE